MDVILEDKRGNVYTLSDDGICIGDDVFNMNSENVYTCKNEQDVFIMNNDLSGPVNIGKVWYKILKKSA